MTIILFISILLIVLGFSLELKDNMAGRFFLAFGGYAFGLALGIMIVDIFFK